MPSSVKPWLISFCESEDSGMLNLILIFFNLIFYFKLETGTRWLVDPLSN